MHGHTALANAQRLVDTINFLPVMPDFIMHTGDVADAPHPDTYALAAEAFGRLRVPVYYVNGNHDARGDIIKYMPMGPVQWLSEGSDQFSYTFDLKGYRFLVLDARGPTSIDPQGQFPAAQLEILRKEIERGGPPLVIFMHYPVLQMDSPWMDANMLVTNGAEFHQVLLQARDRLRAVFHGHVHMSMQTLKDGIAYIGVSSSLNQFSAWPTDQVIGHKPLALPGFNLVHLLPEHTIIYQHTFPEP